MADLSVIPSILEKRHCLIPIETLMNYNANKSRHCWKNRHPPRCNPIINPGVGFDCCWGYCCLVSAHAQTTRATSRGWRSRLQPWQPSASSSHKKPLSVAAPRRFMVPKIDSSVALADSNWWLQTKRWRQIGTDLIQIDLIGNCRKWTVFIFF